jgi:TonB family protein
MSAAAAQAPARTGAVRRRVPRYLVALPVDVNILRSGIPESIPGRSLDIGEGGVAVALAGELLPGDLVGLEFRLPKVGLVLQTKAVVRHQAGLCCGLEFLALPPEQQAMIRDWVSCAPRKQPPNHPSLPPPFADTLYPKPSSPAAHLTQPQWNVVMPRVRWLALAVLVLVAGLGWWQWHRAWDELESRLPQKEARLEQNYAGVAIKIPADVMAQLVTHKVDPVYPDSARESNAQGIVVLDALIGPDGAVEDLHPLSGPDVLAPAAVDAVKWWRFQPYLVNGKPVQVETTLAVEFRPEP